jgi:hypothetical protein
LIRSSIAKNLIASYRHTDYQINISPVPIILKIDLYSEPLAKFLLTSQQSHAAIISAYNPYSQLLNDRENLTAHESLKNFLNQYLYLAVESLNIDPTHKWPVEKSFFVPGLSLNIAQSLGQQFNQNAIIWIQSDAIPRLILLH